MINFYGSFKRFPGLLEIPFDSFGPMQVLYAKHRQAISVPVFSFEIQKLNILTLYLVSGRVDHLHLVLQDVRPDAQLLPFNYI